MAAVLKTVELTAPGVRIPLHQKTLLLYNFFIVEFVLRRGAREAEGNGLLNRGRGNLTEGSNPSLSEAHQGFHEVHRGNN